MAVDVVLDENIEYNFGRVRLTLAVLPYDTFHEFYINADRDQQKRVNAIVAEHGWSNEALGGAEIGYYGEEYKHKYMTLWTQVLD